MPATPPTLYHHAKSGNLAALAEALANNANPDTRDPAIHQTPLMAAVTSPRASLDLVHLLITAGADVNATCSDRDLSPEIIDSALAFLGDEAVATAANLPKNDTLLSMLSEIRNRPPSNKSVLSLALRAGHAGKIRALLAAGADASYTYGEGYSALLEATYSPLSSTPDLLPVLQRLIQKGAPLNAASTYGESALKNASQLGRFDAVRLLLDAGCAPSPALQWTPLMHTVVFGSLEQLQHALRDSPDLAAADEHSRTPWLLSIQAGDVDKAKALLAAGANRSDRGGSGTPPLTYAVKNSHTAMLAWLLSEGFDPNDADNSDETPLMHAAQIGAAESAKILIDAGADIHRTRHGDKAISTAATLEIVHLLVNHGADLNDISDDMRAKLTHLQSDQDPDVSEDDYRAAKHPRFGNANPEKMNFPFWRAMVACGANAYSARARFDDMPTDRTPVWCFKRFGKSITVLPDGRIIEIAGEHEDHYDPDFCIYNDVVVHHGNGTFDIFGYPKSIFPPTDFHTATAVDNKIYIVGSLGYPGERRYSQTPVYELDTDTFEIKQLNTTGNAPGWIHRHIATLTPNNQLKITAGEILSFENEKEISTNNPATYLLNLKTLTWQKSP